MKRHLLYGALLLSLSTVAFIESSWGGTINSLRVTEKAGVNTTNYPAQLGRPFAQGEIANFPQVLIDGMAVMTQADVKQRWADGSVKHAILSFLIPTLVANSSVTITFQDQPTGNNTPLTQLQMLDSVFDFEAQMQLTNGTTQTVSARTILQNAAGCTSLTGSPAPAVGVQTTCTYWTSGPIATTVILADHSGTLSNGMRPYDLGFKDKMITALSATVNSSATTLNVFYGGDITAPAVIQIGSEQLNVSAVNGNTLTVNRAANGTTAASHRVGAVVTTLSINGVPQSSAMKPAPIPSYQSFRPIFIATFWPTINKVRVRFIGEVANTAAIQDQVYSLALTTGSISPTQVYSKPTFTHIGGGRWTKLFWIGGPPSAVAINHNIGYLAPNKFVPNYDLGISVPESAISSAFAVWTSKAKDIFDAGSWTKAMGTAGGRPDIGPYPDWTVRWLYTGDSRMEQQAFGNAELALAWPVHFREGEGGRFFDRAHTIPAIGRVLSLSARPGIMTTNTFLNSSDADVVRRIATLTTNGWDPDDAHMPEPFAPQYLLTGDYIYLEEMYFWCAWAAARPNPGSVHYGRGPTGEFGNIVGEVRGQAWMLRSRVNAVFESPDNSAEQSYFATLLNDTLASWAGARNITGTPFDGNTMWNWGNTVGVQRYGGLGPPPLHQWEKGNSGFVQGPLDSSVVKEAISAFEQNFLLLNLGRAKELGYPTGALTSWLGTNIIGQITDPAYDPHLVGDFRTPTVRLSDSNYFDTWSGMRSAFLAGYDILGNFANRLLDPVHGYPFIALAATSMAANESGGPAAWNWIAQNVLCAPALVGNPKWAIIPRVTSANGVQPNICNVSAPTASVTATSAAITWTTDQASNSKINFGTTNAYGSSSPVDPNMTNTHTVVLNGLTPGTLYHYQAVSTDTFGNQGASQDFTFQTPAQSSTSSPTSISLVSGTTQTGTVGQVLANAFVVKVTDAQSNLVNGWPVTFIVTGGDGSLTAPGGTTGTRVQVITGSNGQATGTASVILILGTVAGINNNTVQASGMNSDGVTLLSGSPVVFTASAGAGSASKLLLVSGDDQSGTVGQPLSSPLVVKVTDSFGNAVSGVSVSFTITAGGGNLSTSQASTNTEGQASTTLTLGIISGANSVSATATGLVGSPVVFSATANVGPPVTISLISGDGQSGKAKQPLTQPLVVGVSDAYGNPVSGVAVMFAVTSGGGSLSATEVTTDPQGTASTTLTLGPKPGTNTVTATSTGLGGSPIIFNATGTAGSSRK